MDIHGRAHHNGEVDAPTDDEVLEIVEAEAERAPSIDAAELVDSQESMFEKETTSEDRLKQSSMNEQKIHETTDLDTVTGIEGELTQKGRSQSSEVDSDMAASDEGEILPVFGLKELLKVLLSPRTLPHLLLLIFASVTLYFFSKDGNEVTGAIAFISFTFSYVLVSLSTRFEALHSLVRISKIEYTTEEGKPKSKYKQLLKQSLKAWFLPLLFFAVLFVTISSLFSEGSTLGGLGSMAPLVVAGLFIFWSIGQGVSFRLAATGALEDKFKPKLCQEKRTPHTNRSIVLQLFTTTVLSLLLLELFFHLMPSSTGTSVQEALLYAGDVDVVGLPFAGLVFVGLVLVPQGVVLQRARGLIRKAGERKDTARFALLWGIAVQSFIVWHLMSVYRKVELISPSDPIGMGEEFILMIVTVMMAIWGLASKSVKSGSSLFTSENALFWGIAFGFAYAGSISMLAALTGTNLKGVMMAGHVITILTLHILHGIALKDHLLSKGIELE